VETVAETVDGVLLPPVDLDLASQNGRADDHVRIARTLYAQCPSTASDRVILVAGASASSGSSSIARLLEMAAAESTPAASAALSSGEQSPPATTRVVAGGVVGDSTLNPEIVRAATDIVLVFRIGTDRVAEAAALRSAVATGSAPLVAVFTYRRNPWRGLWERPGRAKSSATASNPDGTVGRRRAR
jgi:hypothetical protein